MVIKRVSTLEFNDWANLKDAVKKIVANGTYQSLLTYHSHQYRIHAEGDHIEVGRQRFLPWHRAYLIAFENAIRGFHKDLAIPYWDWNKDAGRLRGFSERFGMPLGRPPNGKGKRTPKDEWGEKIRDMSRTEYLLSPNNYYDFTERLEEGPHNHGHDWIGGDMASMESPRDVAFWFHHAQIDRIWALWQQRYRNEKPNLSGDNRILDPWKFDIKSINNIEKLGYRYVEPSDTTA